MIKRKNTKSALLASVISLMLCAAMLVGSTFAWFTDTVTSGKNKIVAGNLDIELEYCTDPSAADAEWKSVQDAENLFGDITLWEPGTTGVVYFRLSNLGTLALKYKLGMNFTDTVIGKNAAGEEIKLSEILEFGIAVGQDTKFETREAAIAAIENAQKVSAGYTTQQSMGVTDEKTYFALVVYMPTTTGNEANYRGEAIPQIDLVLNLVATQDMVENDRFGNDYDKDAPAVTYTVTPETIDAYLNGQYGSMTNAKLVLAPGNYKNIVIGAPTKYEGSDTVYICLDGTDHSKTPVSFTDADEFNAHMADQKWHSVPRYTRAIDNLTIVGQEGVTVEGILISSGHVHRGNSPQIKDPVLDKDCDGYYLTQKLSNITFTNIDFTGKVEINTSNADTVIDGVTFDECTFNINNTAAGNQALRYYNENNNGNVKNLTVKNCAFNSCYQGVYTSNTNGITITGCQFNTTAHNAIALQSTTHGAVNYKSVVIENNTFTKIGDRIIRFGEIDADTQLTIKNNTATESGDSDGEIMKAVSLADGITYDISGNSWGEGKKVYNEQLADK